VCASTKELHLLIHSSFYHLCLPRAFPAAACILFVCSDRYGVDRCSSYLHRPRRPPIPPTGGNILIPPSIAARKLGDYLRVAIGLHCGLAIFLIMGGRYLDGIFDLLGVLIGFMAIRNSEGYSFSCVLGYCVLTGMDLFWSVLRLVLFFAGVTAYGSSSGWQYYVLVIGLVVSPFVYTFSSVTSYYLSKELKKEVEQQVGGVQE
jgi:hypothetical protein